MTPDASGRVAVVIATRNRRDELCSVVGRLTSLPDAPEVVVVDNDSTDGSADAVGERYPGVRVIRAGHNAGCAGRNLGVEATDAAYVAFCDDDSWWSPGALTRAADVFDAHARLALLAARILVGPDERLDPTCAEMAASPLRRAPDLPGPSTLGFVACGAVVRRQAFLEVGGFNERFVIGGEESLLAWDLATAGWGLAYVADVVAHHHPSAVRDVGSRRRRQTRNDLWTSWLRRPLPVAAAQTARVAGAAVTDPAARAGLVDAGRGLPYTVRHRRPLPRAIERQLRLLSG